MPMEIHFTFAGIVSAIAKLFILALAGYILRHRNIIDDKFTDTLSAVLVRLIFPALIIHKTVSNFSFQDFPFWWVLPLAAVVFSVSGMVIGRMLFGLLCRGGDCGPKREFTASCGFQNSGYLPMNIILFAFAGTTGDMLLVYMFLFLAGFNLLIWSFLPVFFERKKVSDVKLGTIFNPPVVATIVSLLWVWIFGKGSIPDVISDPMGQLGQAAFPIAMMTLGAYLSRYRAHLPEKRLMVAAGVTAKLILFPALVLAVISAIPMNMGYRFFLFVEAIMPSAVTLVVVGSYSRADNGYLSSVIFYSHLAAIFTIPLWLGIFRILIPGI
ncbi:MAG: AEC family transporter [Candidatus Omnitrophota bacterium]